MHHFLKAIPLILWAYFPTQAQVAPPAALDSAVQVEAQRGFSGAVLVARGGTIVLHKAYGSERGIPMETSSRFWIASAAKQFTSAAILRCKEKGLLTLNDSVVKFFPDAPADKRGITVRQLLAHTSGLRQGYISEGLNDRTTAVRRMLAEPLANIPGERFGYSNSNYQLAVAIVEIASGKPYGDYVREELWNRAGLSITGFAGESGGTRTAPARDAIPDRLARSYWGGGGVFSSTRDLFIWYRALRKGHILSPANVDTLFAPVANIEEGATALGWFVGRTGRGAATVFTRGNEDFGANALVYAYPQSDVVVVVLTHAGSSSDGRSWSRVILAKIEDLLSL